MSPLLKSTLSSLLDFEIWPNLLNFVLDEEDNKGQEPYDFAKDYGFEDSSFLMNSGSTFSDAFMILCMLPIFFVFSLIKVRKLQ